MTAPQPTAAATPSIFQDVGQTDAANAQRLLRRSGEDIRCCRGSFRVWDGTRWSAGSDLQMEQLAKQTAAGLFDEIGRGLREEFSRNLGAAVSFAKKSNSAAGIAGMLALIRSEPGVLVEPGRFDSDPMLLNLRNGTLDLRTGVLRPHAREDLITKLCPIDLDCADGCPQWEQFILDVFQKDGDLIRFVQRAAGYCLTGDVREQSLFLCVGDGANGKSTFLNLLLELLGPDYAMKAPRDLLAATRQRAHPTELADLRGRRFVAAIETGAYQRLDESLDKELTGGDPIRARRMREDFSEFRPEHKLFLATNHLPEIRGMDEGIWRRIQVIPFNASFPADRQDKELAKKLRGELPGILKWCLDGLAEWLEEGLGSPTAVSSAVADYRAEMDLVGRFVEESCEVGREFRVAGAAIQQAFAEWCTDRGKEVLDAHNLSRQLCARGFVRKTSNGVWYQGLGLRSNPQQD